MIFILADDMGYGDVSCFNPEGKLHTPNIDRIAEEGLACRDAHSTSAICTPSRYSILTGRYCWRTMAKGIVKVYGDALIPSSRMTVADLFRSNGYRTGCFGKWHIGMTWQKGPDGQPDFTRPVLEGPVHNGFDEYFGVDVPNFPPYVYMKNDMVTEQPTHWYAASENLRDSKMEGPGIPDWDMGQILPTITDHACGFIEEQSRKNHPFFVYLPLTSPHEPVAVGEEWQGKSGIGDYGDFVLETDAMVGRVLDTLDRCGIAEDTWILFTTDNGCARYQGCDAMEALGHFPSYHWRGYKTDAWDGGHRIPLVMRWPACIQAGGSYEKYISLSDFMATAADILGCRLPDNAGEDSISFLPVMKGTGDSPRDSLIHHSSRGKFAVRKDNWKLILCAGSGGFPMPGFSGYPSDQAAAELNLPPYQLYHLTEDPSEAHNLYPQHMDKCRELLAVLEDAIVHGRSTPGADQENDIEVIIDPEIDDTPVFEE